MSDTVTSEAIITAARRVSLTTSVITEWAQRGTPRQREYLHGFLEAEHASRQHATHMRLLKAARLPVMKTLDGYDWTAIRFPEGYGQDALTSLEFLDHAGDLVFYGDVGTGKTHLAAALVASACRQGIPARFFTTAGLVAHLRHAKHADRLDQQLAAIGRNKLVAIDELGYLPIDPEGARLLFQVISEAYEKRSLIMTTNLEFSRWGTVFGDDHMCFASDLVRVFWFCITPLLVGIVRSCWRCVVVKVSRAGKKFLAPSEKYEIWLQLVRQETTIARAATVAGVDRSVIVRLSRVAREGALAALAASRPGPADRRRDAELEASRAEVARLSEAVKELAIRLTLAEGKERWD